MARNRRVIAHNIPYFITCDMRWRWSRQKLPIIAEAILSALGAIRTRWNGGPHAYAVMPDHWHALITTHEPHSISRVMNGVKTQSAGAVRRQIGGSGPVWQRRFYDHVCRDIREFEGALDYIHCNPVTAGLVDSPELWPWSSWHAYNQGGSPPIDVDPVEGEFEARWSEWGYHASPDHKAPPPFVAEG